MSSRALRRLGSDSLEATLAKITQKDVENDQHKVRSAKKTQNVNFFALMGDTEQDESEDSEDNYSGKLAEKISTHAVVSLPSKSQKKKNKKKKRANKNPPIEQHEQDNNHEDSDEELARLINQFKKRDIEKGNSVNLGTVTDSSDLDYDTAIEDELENDALEHDIRSDPGFTNFKSFSEIRKVFSDIDMKDLNPDNEFKVLFDDLSPEALADVDSMTSTHVSPQIMKQLERMKKLVRNWGGKDRKSVPNGSTVRRLAFTKIRDDWLPTPRGELVMKQLLPNDIEDWLCWQRPQDWKDEIRKTVQKWTSKGFEFYKFEPLSPDLNRKAMTEFYMSVILHPDHEALINLISSKFPYHVPSLLQVGLILVRQGDKTNSNGLVERALFVFDRALRANVTFNGPACQLPYIYFFNRQFYLAIFRYVQIISQRGAVATASHWCKALWSLSPLEDPLGCRYFMDHFLLLNEEYNYLINLAQSPLLTTYTQWYTLSLSLGIVLSYLRLDSTEKARRELQRSFEHHATSLRRIFTEITLGDSNLLGRLGKLDENATNLLEVKAYMLRMKSLWSPLELKFLHDELLVIISEYNAGNTSILIDVHTVEESRFYIQEFPINLLRFSILSQESSVMACIPESIWSDYEVYEFDVLPPIPTDKESLDVIETIRSFISEDDLSTQQMELMQDEHILNQIRQLSLEQFMQENPNAGIDE